MTKHISVITKAWTFGIAAIFALAIVPSAFAQDIVKADITFPFHVGAKTLPAGAYEFTVDRVDGSVSVHGPKGADAMEMIVTTLAPPPHNGATDAHVIFDKVGSNYALSEIWEPGMDGVLVFATKGQHEHAVIHVKKVRQT